MGLSRPASLAHIVANLMIRTLVARFLGLLHERLPTSSTSPVMYISRLKGKTDSVCWLYVIRACENMRVTKAERVEMRHTENFA